VIITRGQPGPGQRGRHLRPIVRRRKSAL